jgi:hypothetical protein
MARKANLVEMLLLVILNDGLVDRAVIAANQEFFGTADGERGIQ